MFFICSYFSVCLGNIPDCAQGFLLFLLSGIIPGRLEEPYVVMGIKPILATCRARALPILLSHWPKIFVVPFSSPSPSGCLRYLISFSCELVPPLSLALSLFSLLMRFLKLECYLEMVPDILHRFFSNISIVFVIYYKCY